LLFHAVARLRAARLIETIVVAVPSGHEHVIAAELGVQAVAGGASRQESVLAALRSLPATCDVVLVHDAARPLAPVTLIEAVADAVLAGAPAVVPGLEVADTIKRVDARGVVVETPPRERLRAVQTPQGFRRELLERAHARALGGATRDTAITDDAGLVELLGEPVLVIPGDPDAFKITRPDDLLRAQARLGAQPAATAR
jgi:2-C-methyl-D-erythritol 4-phosphate cytidylyltransferase